MVVERISVDYLRCAILCFAPGLCGCPVFIVVTVAPPPHGIIVLLPIVYLIVVVGGADGRLVLRERGGRFRLDVVGVELLVEGIEVLELEDILLGGQEGL